MKRVINLWSITGAISVALFVSVELAATAAAAIWAIAGLLGLGTSATLILGAFVTLASLYGIALIFILAFRAETDPENN